MIPSWPKFKYIIRYNATYQWSRTNYAYVCSFSDALTFIKYHTNIDYVQLYKIESDSYAQLREKWVPSYRDFYKPMSYTLSTGEAQIFNKLWLKENYISEMYSYPIYILQYQKKPIHKRKRRNYKPKCKSHIPKRIIVANTDPEYKKYLRSRQKRIHNNYKHNQVHNQFNLGNSWKTHGKYHKQWAKHSN